MLKKIKNKINFNKLVNNSNNRKYLIIVCFFVVLLIIFLLFYFIGRTSLVTGVDSSVRNEFKKWVLLEDGSGKYTVDMAIDKSLNKVKWKYDKKLDLITVSGEDKSSDDNIVITFSNNGSVEFKSMTRNGVDISYSDWYSYLMSYRD